MDVLVVDDEPLARQLMLEYLQAYPQITSIRQAGDGFTALKLAQESKPDLMILDVQMPKLTGLEVVELLADPPAVIFATAFDHYAVQAFEAAAIDYLLKPVSQTRFNKAMDRVLAGGANGVKQEMLPSPAEAAHRLAVRHRGAVVLVPVPSIIYIQAEDDLMKIVTADQVYYKTSTLTKLEQSLPAHVFMRVHRSIVVQVGLIQRLEGTGTGSHQALMNNGDRVPVSESGYARLRGKD